MVDINEASSLLRAGEVVAFPTETVYGLGADASNPEAIKKIYSLKGRPSHNPLIVHLACIDQVEQFAVIPPHSKLKERFLKLSTLWPGPLTIVFPERRKGISDLVTARQNSVGIRIPSHPIAHELLKNCQLPIAAPSANRSEYVSATHADHVRECFGDKVEILDGGQATLGLESTIVMLHEDAPPQLLRPGCIPTEEIASRLGEPVLSHEAPQGFNLPLLSPGLTQKHYSPRTPLILLEQLKSAPTRSWGDTSIACILLSKKSPIPPEVPPNSRIFFLSEAGGHEEIAKNLYSLLRFLDKKGFQLICIEAPNGGLLSDALMDRVRRAAAPGKASTQETRA